MAGLLIEARDAASTARQAGQSALDAAVLDNLVARYRTLAAAGLAAQPLPADRDREGRPPHRPPVPRLRGPHPPLCYPP